jgi:AraC-like DNA-binding protein
MFLLNTDSYPNKFTDGTHDSFMEHMARILRTDYANGQIILPVIVGSGFLKNHHIEEGLSIRNLNFTLAIDFEFVRLAKVETEEKIFQLYFFLNNSDFRFTLGNDKEPLKPSAFSNTILLTNDMNVHGRFSKNDSVKVIIISFSVSWLQKNGFESYEWFKPVLASKENDKGLLLLESLNMTDFTTASELNTLLVPNAEYIFTIKTDAFLLIKRFFDAIEKRNDMDMHKTRPDYFFEMVKVEHRISEYLTANLPVIKVLSKEFNMSDSNLKRHFRIVYGKNIYEYYLEKKMTLAKDMILNEGKSISIVAYSLGYEKVSSFSKAFKKMYGVVPSDLKHNKIA